VLSRYPFVRTDPHFSEMVAAITAQADANGRYTAGSMHQAWKGWSFADRRQPSPWLTFLALRIQQRVGELTAIAQQGVRLGAGVEPLQSLILP
jgi:hypothetical protein